MFWGSGANLAQLALCCGACKSGRRDCPSCGPGAGKHSGACSGSQHWDKGTWLLGPTSRKVSLGSCARACCPVACW